MQAENATPNVSPSEGATEASNDTVTPPKAEAEVAKPETPQKYKVKAAGREEELTTDELIRRYQNTAGYESKAKEIQRLAKEVEAREAKFADPQTALRELFERHGEKARALIEQYYKQQSQEREQLDSMTERERYLYQMAQQQQQQLAQLEEYKQQHEQTQQQAIEEQAIAQLQDEIGGITVEALKSINIPDSLKGKAMRWLLPELQAHLEAGMKPDPVKVGAIFKAEMDDMVSSVLNAYTQPQLMEVYPDLAKKLALAYLEKVRGGKVMQSKAEPKLEPKQKPKGKGIYGNFWEDNE